MIFNLTDMDRSRLLTELGATTIGRNREGNRSSADLSRWLVNAMLAATPDFAECDRRLPKGSRTREAPVARDQGAVKASS
jgi:hypothetical protein